MKVMFKLFPEGTMFEEDEKTLVKNLKEDNFMYSPIYETDLMCYEGNFFYNEKVSLDVFFYLIDHYDEYFEEVWISDRREK